MKHGTVTGYVYHKCRCAKCRAAQTDRARRYRATKGADYFVSSTRAIEHLGKLRTRNAVIARITGLNWNTLNLLRTRSEILKSTERKIMAVSRAKILEFFMTTKKGHIPAAPTQMLLEDLKVSGFSMWGFSRTAGLKSEIRVRYRRIQAGHARRIEKLYRRTGAAA